MSIDFKTLKAAIPAHCFKRSFTTSTLYLLRDVALSAIATWIYIATIPATCPSSPLYAMLWMVAQLAWFWVQGVIWTGLWVIGHECGHHAYCESNVVNDAFGYVIHSFLLVPFFSWQYTHGRHHKNNNHLLDNETHVPSTRAGFERFFGNMVDTVGEDAFVAFQIFSHLILGWPMYIFFGFTGCRRTPNGTRVKGWHTHFQPNNNAFHRSFPNWKVWASTFGVFSMSSVLVYWAKQRGFSEVARFYLGPYIVTNLWLVLYTWLHHTHPSIPHYGEGEWNWFRGARSTIDRDYGIYDFFHHEIGSTHVCHHIFSKIPHYHAKEATECLKRALGDDYMYSDEFWMKSVWNTARDCLFVESVEGVQYYKGLDDLKKKKSG